MNDSLEPKAQTGLDAAEMKEILQQADLRVLLMCLVHITGDLSWLEPPFTPKRDVRLIPDPTAGLDEDAQAAIRQAAMALLLEGRHAAAIHDPGDELMQRMMSVSLGEEVPPEYAPMVREELGFVSRAYTLDEASQADPTSQRNQASQSDRASQSDQAFQRGASEEGVVIVGAGVSGIALAVRLKEMGVPFVILERSNNLGGVWNHNRYPGCGVDTPNHSYSYSFGERYPWSRYFSPREEILDYIEGIVDQYGLRDHIRFDATVTGAVWNHDTQRWDIEYATPAGQARMSGRYFVSAIGQLSDPFIPALKGKEDYKGRSFHSMHWPTDLDVAGKRVAVIGTGATSMQLVPSIYKKASQVDVYQRTAQWVRPIEGYAESIKPGARWLLRNMPYYAQWFRFNMFWRYGDGLLACLNRDPEWPHQERSVNRTNDRHREEMLAFIEKHLEDRPDLLKKCVPEYPPYGKRILLDNNWYGTLKEPNVELITDRIERVTESGIKTTSGEERPADIIVYATGFKLTEMAARLNVSGLHGQSLQDLWSDGDPQAYLGMTVSGFPNFFMMIGPNSAPAHGGSVIFQAECQARYITACIAQMRERGIGAIDLKPEVLRQHVEEIDAAHEKLVWTHPSVSTYYRNAKGRVFSVIPWRFVDFWKMTHEPRLDDYVVYPKVPEPNSVHAQVSMEERSATKRSEARDCDSLH